MASGPRSRCTEVMNRRPWIAATVAIATLALVVGLALFQPWRLITRSTVDDPLPTAQPAVAPGTATTGTDDMHHTGTSTTAAPDWPRVLSEGGFVDGEHATSGTARVLALADGTRILRLEGFTTSDGPDVDVWLTDQPSGDADWHRYDDGRYVSLGDLKGTDGNQNYVIPADTELRGLVSVVIWCDRFDVAFGTAPIRTS